jgi:exonuclease III
MVLVPTAQYDIFTRHQPTHSSDTHGDHFGDELLLLKPVNTTRCEFRNINGISIGKQGLQFRDVFEQECDISADLFGLSETKLNQQNSTVSCLYHQTAQPAFGMHHCGVFGSSDIHYASPFRFGGTLTMAVDDTRGRVLDIISDSWGRWTALELRAKGDRKVLYITAYQVCAAPTNTRGSTAYQQQEAMAHLAHRPIENTRYNFQRDLRKFIFEKQHQQYSIILGGDFNDSLTQSRSGMRSLAIQCQLTDVWSHKYPGVEFNMRHPGSKRIAYVLVTPVLIHGVESVGYFPSKYRGKRDHWGIYIDFDTQVLFGNATHKLATTMQRGFKSTNPFAVTNYLTSAGQHSRSNKLFTLFATLATLDALDHVLAEKIDDIIGQAMMHGEKQCRPRRPSWWSRKLHRFRLWKSFLERAISGYRTKGEFTGTLQRLMKINHL